MLTAYIKIIEYAFVKKYIQCMLETKSVLHFTPKTVCCTVGKTSNIKVLPYYKLQTAHLNWKSQGFKTTMMSVRNALISLARSYSTDDWLPPHSREQLPPPRERPVWHQITCDGLHLKQSFKQL